MCFCTNFHLECSERVPHVEQELLTFPEHLSSSKFRAMVFNATFNNISVISWRSVLLVEETGVPGENHRLSQVTDKRIHIMLYRVDLN
jgi:hypothetical protein